MPLSVVLSNTAGVPIYEQIAQQVRDAILTCLLYTSDAADE